MMRTFLALMVITTSAYAQSFVIERVEVTAAHARPAIVRAETRLVAGRAYTVEQLDRAVYRVRRLPFIVDATYSLEAGQSRTVTVRFSPTAEGPATGTLSLFGDGGASVDLAGIGGPAAPQPE